MSTKANALKTLYKRNRITKQGLIEAVNSGIITQAEFEEIVGEENE